MERGARKPGRTAAVTAVTGGVLLFGTAVCYGYIVGTSWLYTSTSVAVSTGALEMVFSPSLLTTLLYLLPLLSLLAAAVLAIVGGKRLRRTPAFWALAMMGVAAIAYKLIPPQSFMTAYYTVYRSFPLLQELAVQGVTLSLLLYLLSLLLLLVFMGICPPHKMKGNEGVIEHEA